MSKFARIVRYTIACLPCAALLVVAVLFFIGATQHSPEEGPRYAAFGIVFIFLGLVWLGLGLIMTNYNIACAESEKAEKMSHLVIPQR